MIDVAIMKTGKVKRAGIMIVGANVRFAAFTSSLRLNSSYNTKIVSIYKWSTGNENNVRSR